MATILIADDSPTAVTLLRRILQPLGHQIVVAADGDEAARAVVEGPPDLIILDVVMPQMDGFRLCQRVRAHPGLQLTPIIFVTRKGDVEQRVRGLQVTQPQEDREMTALVREAVLQLPESQRTRYQLLYERALGASR